MLRRPFCIDAVAMLAIALFVAAAVAWAPAGIVPTSDTIETVFAKLRGEDRDAGLETAQRIDRYLVTAGSRTVDVEALIRGDDYALGAEPAGILPQLGRTGGERWRKSASGTVHRIRADVQGDDFDRWPVTELGYDAADCTLAGVADVPQRTWVLKDRPRFDIPRWLFIDQQSGDVVREISREGNRVETFDFSDVRGQPGARRPYGFRVVGPGGQVSVALTQANPAEVTPSDVSVPAQGPPEFEAPSIPTEVHAAFDAYSRITMGVRVDGERRKFQLDSGTPELILSRVPSEVAPIVLEHGVAQRLDVDGVRATNAAFLSVDFWEDGLLGYEFFRGRIVHVDYRARRIDILPRESFVAPVDAIPLPTDWSEGLPIATATVGKAAGARFALDLGSSELYLSRAFVDQAGSAANLDLKRATARRTAYLEGAISILDKVRAPELFLGNVRFVDVTAEVEVADRDNLSIPLDGIIGTDELAHCEWWFDADGPISWFRPYQ